MKQLYTTVHSLRASFCTCGTGTAHCKRDIRVTALSRIFSDVTVRAYHRSDMVENRRKLMSE